MPRCADGDVDGINRESHHSCYWTTVFQAGHLRPLFVVVLNRWLFRIKNPISRLIRCLSRSLRVHRCHLSVQSTTIRAQPQKSPMHVIVLSWFLPSYFVSWSLKLPCFIPLHNMAYRADYTSARSCIPSVLSQTDNNAVSDLRCHLHPQKPYVLSNVYL